MPKYLKLGKDWTSDYPREHEVQVLLVTPIATYQVCVFLYF
jgi:hypothetical protein